MADCEKCALKCTDEIKITKHHKGRMPMGKCIDFMPKQTNADRIRSMSDEELAVIIMCPYDTAESGLDQMPCAKDGIQKMVTVEECRKCSIAWLQSEVEG